MVKEKATRPGLSEFFLKFMVWPDLISMIIQVIFFIVDIYRSHFSIFNTYKSSYAVPYVSRLVEYKVFCCCIVVGMIFIFAMMMYHFVFAV